MLGLRGSKSTEGQELEDAISTNSRYRNIIITDGTDYTRQWERVSALDRLEDSFSERTACLRSDPFNFYGVGYV